MRQLITRLDDNLHARLKAHAEREGKSMNTLVTEALRKELEPSDEHAEWRRQQRELKEKAERLGIQFVHPIDPDAPPPDAAELDAFIESTRGQGTVVDLLLEQRKERW